MSVVASLGKDIMAFVARCNYCSSRFKLDNADLGGSRKCPKCGNQFTAFPLEETHVQAANVHGVAQTAQTAAVTPTPPEPATGSGDSCAPATNGSRVRATAESGERAMPVPHIQGTHPAIAFGMAGFILGGFAWLFASITLLSILPLPLSILGVLLVGLGCLSDDKNSLGKIWLGLGGAASLSILLTIIFWPTFFSVVRGRAELPDYSKPLIVSATKDHKALRPLTEEFLDADEGALRLENFQVRVLGAEFMKGPLDKAPSKKQVVRIGLQVSCVVAGGADQSLKFESWAQHGARLLDVKGQAVPPAAGPQSKDTKPLVAKGPAPLLPGNMVEDVLFFDASQAPPPWILELPNAAWGKPGSLKFRIGPEFMQGPAFPGKGGQPVP